MFKWLLVALLSCSYSAVAADATQPVSKVVPKSVGVATVTADGTLVLGEEESIYVKDLNRNLLSRVDTGATTSSIGAKDIETSKKDGKSYVTFKLAHKDWESETMTLPVERWAEVRQSSTEELSDPRPVVNLAIQIGEYKSVTEFSLTDRSHLEYPILLGRTFIDNVAIVDVSHKNIQPIVTIKKEEQADTEKSKETK